MNVLTQTHTHARERGNAHRREDGIDTNSSQYVLRYSLLFAYLTQAIIEHFFRAICLVRKIHLRGNVNTNSVAIMFMGNSEEKSIHANDDL